MEPERRIEKLLRAFAKKRREQAGDPMKLHPVARQQLQKEIARRAAGTKSGGGWFSNLFLGLRPGLAFALCFTALVVAGLILLPNLRGRKPSTLASANLSRQEMAPAKRTPPALMPPPMTAPASPADEDVQVSQDKGAAVSGTVAMQPTQPAVANRRFIVPPAETSKQAAVVESRITQTKAPTGIATASPAPSNITFAFENVREAAPAFGGGGFGGAGALRKDEGAQPSPAAPPAPRIIGAPGNGTILAANEDTRKKLNVQTQSVSPSTVSAAFFDSGKTQVVAATPPTWQIFNRSDILRTSDASSGLSPVLLTFRVEQTGNAMRVVDADGSVYTGAVQVAQQPGAAPAAAPQNAPVVDSITFAAAQSQTAQNYFFRVAGTNRNLKQNVIFSGNLIPLTNAPLLTGGGGGRRALQLPAESLLSNSRIAGKAVIGDQKEIEVNAAPAP